MSEKYICREGFGGWWLIETQYACINGLSAWFVIASVAPAEEAEMGYTDGAFGDAEDRAKMIVTRLNAPKPMDRPNVKLERS